MPFVGGNGFNFVALGPAPFVHPLVEEYWRHWEERRDDPTRLNGHVAGPKVGIIRQVVVADSDEEALELARSAHAHWYETILGLWWAHDDHTYDELFAWEHAVEHETIVFGSPDSVREQVARMLEQSGCNYLACSFAWGNLPHEHALRSLRLFASDVMPAFT
jgi:alkanesulfonate monooxygenase SsuD/methylene tetrahydromethanopterin reductase-like flavin-dependent oxidoreductase (luciferase family)